MQSKTIQFLNYSSSGLLLAIAVALFIGSRTSADVILPHDPIFGVSIRHLFWIVGGIGLVVALFTLAGEPTFTRVMVLAWLSTCFAMYCLGIFWNGGHGLGGYLGNFANAFGISAATAGIVAEVALAYLILSSYSMSVCLWWESRRGATEDSIEISCPACGGHVTFTTTNLGQEMPCPHCQKTITLLKPA